MCSLLLLSNTLSRTLRALSVCSQSVNGSAANALQFSSWLSRLQPIHTKSNNSTHSTSHGPYPVSIRTHDADEQNVKTRTETRVITEDCSATDDMVRTTIVEMIPSTRVLEYTPSYRTTKTVIQTVLYDVTKTASSTRSRKPTKHTLTETVSSPSSTTSKSSRKHTRSKKHTRSSNTTASPPPSSSVSSFGSSKSVVVVTTSEVVEVVTVGYTEVATTLTLSEGDSRLSSMTQTSSTGSSSATGSLNWPPYLTDLSKFSYPPLPTWSADAVVGEVKDMATSNPSPFSRFSRTIHHNATSKTYSPLDLLHHSTTSKTHTPVDVLHHTTTPAVLPAAETQGANDIVENLSARDDDDDPDHDYKKYRKPDKAMSKRMSRWSKHHSKLMRKQSSYKSEAWIKSYSKSIKSANKASKKKHHHDDDDDQVASAGLPAREVSMAAPATTYVEVTVTTTVLPTQNGTYSISFRTVHASKTASVMDGVSTSKASKKHSKTHSKAFSKTSSKAHKSSSKTLSKTASPTASEIDSFTHGFPPKSTVTGDNGM